MARCTLQMTQGMPQRLQLLRAGALSKRRARSPLLAAQARTAAQVGLPVAVVVALVAAAQRKRPRWSGGQEEDLAIFMQ